MHPRYLLAEISRPAGHSSHQRRRAPLEKGVYAARKKRDLKARIEENRIVTRWLSLPLAFLPLGCCVDRAPVEQAPPPNQAVVQVIADDAARETNYTIASGDCRITWTVFHTPVNAGVIRHRPDCPLDLAGQAPFITAVLKKVIESDADAQRFRSLMWGRLHPDNAREATMAVRLALAAKNAPDWDASRGRPRLGGNEAWAHRAMERANVYGELKSVFAAHGLEIRLASVEKVLVLQAGKLKFFPELRAAGVGVADKLPFDCQTWFHVRPHGSAGAP